MNYEQYNPDIHNISNKIRNNSLNATSIRGNLREGRKARNKNRFGLKKEQALNTTIFPTKVPVAFEIKRSSSKKKTQKISQSQDSTSLITQSLNKYFLRVQREKIKKKQKNEKITNFGMNITQIKCDEIRSKLQEKRQAESLLKQQREKNIHFKGKTHSQPFHNSKISSEMKKDISQKCKTEKSEYPISQTQFVPKRRFIWNDKKQKQEQRTLENKIKRMKEFFTILLNSFVVYIDNRETVPTNNLEKKKKKYTYYIGKGNNKNLILSILKKRWWWTEAEDAASADFVWTQLKIFAILQKENSMLHSDLEQPKSILYSKEPLAEKILKKKQSEQDANLKKIFHQNHAKKFYQKLNVRDQKNFLREIAVPNVLHNHYEANYMLGNKKALFYNVISYKEYKHEDPFEFMPLTFHIKKINSRVFRLFQKKAKQSKNCCWIVKPGENSNRGQGIFVTTSLEKIRKKIQKNKKHTFIIQKYMKNVFLFQRRKFDIRTYLLMVSIGGVRKFYWYDEGYLRTCSQIYDINDLDDPFIHLTNDAIQSNGDNYSKFEKGNKITYYQFQRYLDINFPKQKYSIKNLNQKMKKIAKQVIKATYFKLDPYQKQCNFELFGMDFLIDSNFKPWLLEVNTNPCLQLSSPVLQRLIPRMIQNLFRIVVDPLFQPAYLQLSRTLTCYLPENTLESNRFSLIFDSLFDRMEEWEQQTRNLGEQEVFQDQEEEFDDDGEIINIED